MHFGSGFVRVCCHIEAERSQLSHQGRPVLYQVWFDEISEEEEVEERY